MDLAGVLCYHHARNLLPRLLPDTKEILTFPKTKIVGSEVILKTVGKEINISEYSERMSSMVLEEF
jgi:hypothetical protein